MTWTDEQYDYPAVAETHCEVVVAEFHWGVTRCGEVATATIHDGYGFPRRVCPEHTP